MLKLTINAVDSSSNSVNVTFNGREISVSLDAVLQSVFVIMHVHEKKRI